MKFHLIATAVGVSSFVVGGTVGYKLAEKRLSDRFEERLARETQDMREFYTIHRKKYPNPSVAAAELIPGTLLTPEEIATENVAYHKIVKGEGYVTSEVVVENAEVYEGKEIPQNIFDSRPDPDNPYIISQEDFMQNEGSFEQPTLTYYEKDDKLTDEREDLIDDVDKVVGLEFKVNFGEGSSDENTVHVRNERLRMDFEIVRSEGAYAVEVLGMDEVPMDTPRSRRQRGV
jgi:hypothetical protein